MKRNVKRLTLNRETLRSLDTTEMYAAQGGAGSENICQTTQRNCPVFSNTCFADCHSQATCPTRCQPICHGVQ